MGSSTGAGSVKGSPMPGPNFLPNLVMYLNWTFIFEWHVIWLGSNNKYKKTGV